MTLIYKDAERKFLTIINTQKGDYVKKKTLNCKTNLSFTQNLKYQGR